MNFEKVCSPFQHLLTFSKSMSRSRTLLLFDDYLREYFWGMGGGGYICFVGNGVLNIFLYDNNTAIYDYDALRLSKWYQFDMQRIWLKCYCYIYCLYIKYNWTQQPKPNSKAFRSLIWKVIIPFKNTSILHFDNISLAPDF